MSKFGSELKAELNNESNRIGVKTNTNIVTHPNAAVSCSHSLKPLLRTLLHNSLKANAPADLMNESLPLFPGIVRPAAHLNSSDPAQ